jgi:hypothetical protein
MHLFVWEADVINEAFDPRTLARMNLALERVCEKAVNGEAHSVRKRIASRIIKCASSGKTTLDELIAAGQRAVARQPRSSGISGHLDAGTTKRRAR